MSSYTTPIASLLLSLLFAQTAIGQSCKFDRDEADPITGEHIRSESISLLNGTTLRLGTVGGRPELLVSTGLDGERSFTVPRGSLLIVKLANGDTMHLHTRDVATPTIYRKADVASGSTHYVLAFDLPLGFYARLSE